MMQTAFSSTKAKWRRFPLVEMKNLQDLSEVESYRGKYPYVWVKKKDTEIQANFNWNFIPQEGNDNKIHTFPSCNPYSKRPISWEVLKLVPTTEHDDQIEVKSNQIASYQYVNNCMYIYAYHDKFVMKKYGMLSINERPSHLINSKKSMTEILESLSEEDQPFWLIHADVRIDNVRSLDYEIGNDDAVLFPVLHQSTALTYADQSVMLCKPSYIKKTLVSKEKQEPFMIDPISGELVANPYYGEDLIKIKVAKDSIGYMNDTVDPFKAWANAYFTTVNLEHNDNKHITKVKNKVMTAYTKLESSRVNDLVIAGMQEAQIDMAKTDFDYEQSINWDFILKRFSEWNNKTNSETAELLDKRIARIKKIYGEDSEEYQKLSSQLGKSSL